MHTKKTVLTLIMALLATSAAAASLDRGGDVRLRQVFIGNVGLHDHSKTADRTFQRYRGRLCGRYVPADWLAADARLMWEGRHYDQPEKQDWPVPGFETWYSGGVLLDQLALTVSQPGRVPVTVKAGRQDIRLGDGWLVLEGTPLDGSRTLYFDAVRATVDATPIDTRLDLIYIDQYADTDRFPRPLNGDIEDQTEQDETGVVLWAHNETLLGAGSLDGYFIYKHDRPNPTPGNIRVNNGAPFPSPTDSGDIYAAGLRTELTLAQRWALEAEGVYEWGERNDSTLSAFAAKAGLAYAFGDPRANRLHADIEYLSGDDPGDGTDQAFDPLWGRWPQWSELMIYQWPLETRVAEATNLLRLNLGWAAKPHPTTEVLLDYHALFANEHSTRTPAQLANISGDSLFRGHLLTGWVKTRLNSHVAGHLVAEYLAPGDYYAPQRRDASYFLRAELVLTF